MLMIPGGGATLLSRFCMAIKPPKLVLVSAHDATTMAAFGAAALDHSTSTSASPSSGLTPGSIQVAPCGEFFDGCGWIWAREAKGNLDCRPKVRRNIVQSAGEKMSLSSTTTIV